MADFSGIGAFGSAALEGYDKSLSNYAQIAQIARQREAARRAEQALQLQNLLHGNKLAQESPEVAELAAQDPDRYGLSPETIGPGATQARAQRAAMARLNQALSTGDLDALNDPDVARNISEKHLPLIKEMQDRKKVDAIMTGPGTPQEKARALVGLGAKVDGGMLDRAYPDFKGAEAEATAAGTARGQLPLKESLAEAQAVGTGRGELQFKGRLAQAGKEGEIRADLGADVGAGVPPGGTNVGRIARERETEADRTRKLRGPGSGGMEQKDLSVVMGRNRTQARMEAEQLLRTSSKMFQAMPPADRAALLDYYTEVKLNRLLSQDPGWQGQPQRPDPAKSPVVVKFEAEGQPGERGAFMKWLLGESTPTTPVTNATAPPRTLRTPASPAQGGWGKAEVVR